MKINGQVQKILANYESDNPGTKANLARILMHGKLPSLLRASSADICPYTPGRSPSQPARAES